MRKTISKTFDLKITSDYAYSLNLGTTLTEEVEVTNDADYLVHCERLAALTKAATKKDLSDMLKAVKILATQPVPATDAKKGEAIKSLKGLITRMEALGIS